jgi:membrane protease YdiL (CAAX protease family)
LKPADYLRATRHPWPCLLFLLPLLGAYEGGLLWMGAEHARHYRNGADAWLRWWLEGFGIRHLAAAPALILVVFGIWNLSRQSDRPKDSPSVCLGITLESLLFALALWAFGRSFSPLLDRLGITISLGRAPADVAGQMITFVGAGIYEEAIFRLALFNALVALLRVTQFPLAGSVSLAALASAVLFALAHHAGPYGEKIDGFVFLFRSLAGVYFALLFQLRGFGVAVGAHAGYDVLVGITA